MADTLALVGGRVITGTTAGVIEGATVLVEAGRISRVSAEGSGAVPPEGAVVIDVAGHTVLPGLIDAHVHLTSSDGRDPVPAMGHLLAAGITTVRDLGAVGRSLEELRERAARGEVETPRLVLCGQVISAVCPGAVAFPGMYREVTGADDARVAVNEQAARGADVIKVMSTGALTVAGEDIRPAQLSVEEVTAIVEEGHRLGLPVASHAEGAAGVRISVEAGADTIEHGEESYLLPDVLDEMAARGVILVPTLSVFDYVVESDAFPAWMRERARGLGEQARRSVEAASRHGVGIAMGADAPPQGGNAQELVRLADAGLTAGEAIAAATSVAARACRIDDLVGTVEPGKVADLLVVDGDPLGDVRLLADHRAISLVLREGIVVTADRT